MRKATDSSSEKTTLLKIKVSDYERSLGGVPETVPPGFRTAEEWSKIWDKPIISTRTLLCRLVSVGKMRGERFVIDRGINSYPVKHYKAVPP